MIPEAMDAAWMKLAVQMDCDPDDRGMFEVQLHEALNAALESAAPFIRAQALEDAAQELARLPYVKPDAEGRYEYERMLDIRRGNTDGWLLARAASERGGE